MKVKITADSTCDLSPELCEKYNITLAPLSVIIDGGSFHDGVDVNPETIFRAVDLGKSVKTTAVNQYEYEELFREQLKEYDEIVHITISSSMSSCYTDACEAAKQTGRVYVVDSRRQGRTRYAPASPCRISDTCTAAGAAADSRPSGRS